MRLKYVGPHDAVEVPLPGGGWKIVECFAAEEFPEDVARGLLAYGELHWKKAGLPERAAPVATKADVPVAENKE